MRSRRRELPARSAQLQVTRGSEGRREFGGRLAWPSGASRTPRSIGRVWTGERPARAPGAPGIPRAAAAAARQGGGGPCAAGPVAGRGVRAARDLRGSRAGVAAAAAMQEIIASVDHIKFDLEIAVEQQLGAQPLPFPGMDSERGAVAAGEGRDRLGPGTPPPRFGTPSPWVPGPSPHRSWNYPPPILGLPFPHSDSGAPLSPVFEPLGLF